MNMWKHFNPKYDYTIDLELQKYDKEKFQSEEKRIAENSAILFFMKPPVCIKNEIYN